LSELRALYATIVGGVPWVPALLSPGAGSRGESLGGLINSDDEVRDSSAVLRRRGESRNPGAQRLAHWFQERRRAVRVDEEHSLQSSNQPVDLGNYRVVAGSPRSRV